MVTFDEISLSAEEVDSLAKLKDAKSLKSNEIECFTRLNALGFLSANNSDKISESGKAIPVPESYSLSKRYDEYLSYLQSKVALDIQRDAKKIAQYLMERTLEQGNMKDSIPVEYDTLTSCLGLKDSKYSRVCLEYLEGIGCVSLSYSGRNNVSVVCKAKAVDFLAQKKLI